MFKSFLQKKFFSSSINSLQSIISKVKSSVKWESKLDLDVIRTSKEQDRLTCYQFVTFKYNTVAANIVQNNIHISPFFKIIHNSKAITQNNPNKQKLFEQLLLSANKLTGFQKHLSCSMLYKSIADSKRDNSDVVSEVFSLYNDAFVSAKQGIKQILAQQNIEEYKSLLRVELLIESVFESQMKVIELGCICYPISKESVYIMNGKLAQVVGLVDQSVVSHTDRFFNYCLMGTTYLCCDQKLSQEQKITALSYLKTLAWKSLQTWSPQRHHESIKVEACLCFFAIQAKQMDMQGKKSFTPVLSQLIKLLLERFGRNEQERKLMKKQLEKCMSSIVSKRSNGQEALISQIIRLY